MNNVKHNAKLIRWTTVLMLVCMAVVAVLMTGCTPKHQKTASSPVVPVNGVSGGVVTYAIWSPPKGVFHPSYGDDDYDLAVCSLVYESLIRLKPDLTYEPCLAQSYTVSEDKKSVTFVLRPDVKWHDGKPFTAEDVVFTFESIANLDYTGPRYAEVDAIKGAEAYHHGQSDHIEGIEVLNDHTVKITTNDVYGPFMADIGARSIIPAHIWKPIPVAQWPDRTDLLSSPVGTGPFKMKTFVKNDHVALTAYADYWAGRPFLDGFDLKVANFETAQAQLLSGQLDFMQVSQLKKDSRSLYHQSGIVLEEVSQKGYQFLGINNRLDIFSDKRVRQALAYAINRQGIVDSIMGGAGKIVDAPIPSFSWATPPVGLNTYAYDPQKAINLMTSVDGFTYRDGRMYYSGKPVVFTLKYPSGNKVREQSAPLIKRYLESIGIDVNLSIMDFNALMDQVVDKQEFELFLMGATSSEDPDPSELWRSDLTRPGGWNMCGFVNAESDKLMEQARGLIEVEDRKPIYYSWGKLMNEEMPEVFLYTMTEGRAYSSKLKGVQISPFSDFYDVNHWYKVK